MRKSRVTILAVTFIIAFFYQPNWIYYNFYFNPKWVDSAWWSTPYWVYLLIYSIIATLFIELTIRFIKKYA
jgi:hypothetical protein